MKNVNELGQTHGHVKNVDELGHTPGHVKNVDVLGRQSGHARIEVASLGSVPKPDHVGGHQVPQAVGQLCSVQPTLQAGV